MRLGLGLGLPAGGGQFNPAILFANGEQGAWYDPSDLSTVFQDRTGQTAGAAGSVVGLILDKSKALAVGSELLGTGAAALTGSATAATYNTSTGAGTCTRVDGSNQSYVTFGSLPASITFYRLTIQNTGAVSVLVRAGGSGGSTWITIIAGDTQTFYISSLGGANISITSAGGAAAFTVVSVKSIAGNHAYQGTAASKPILRQSGGLSYLEFDGTDDYLLTNAIDMTGGDSVTLFAGVRKGSDSAIAILAEFSADMSANAGAFYVAAPEDTGASGNFSFSSRGSVTPSPIKFAATAPVTKVLTAISDISLDSMTLRADGAQVATSSADQGTGNLGNYALYLGRRGGVSLPFTGYLYGFIMRAGASDTTAITRTERYMAGKAGVVI